MNKILQTVSLISEYKNLNSVQFEEMVRDMEDYAYNNSLIGDLIPLKNLNPYTINISDFDYEIITGSYEFEDYVFYTIDDIEDFLEEKKSEVMAKYNERIHIAYDEKNNTYSIFDIISKEEFLKNISTYEEAAFTKEDIIREKVYDDMAEKYPTVDDFEFYQDEVIFNFAWKFGDWEIDIDNANESGLAVIEMNEERYLAFTSCGMDLSFQLFKYMVLTFNSIDESFISRLGAIKDSMGKKEFFEYLEKLGLKTEKINMDKFNRRY